MLLFVWTTRKEHKKYIKVLLPALLFFKYTHFLSQTTLVRMNLGHAEDRYCARPPGHHAKTFCHSLKFVISQRTLGYHRKWAAYADDNLLSRDMAQWREFPLWIKSIPLIIPLPWAVHCSFTTVLKISLVLQMVQFTVLRRSLKRLSWPHFANFRSATTRSYTRMEH